MNRTITILATTALVLILDLSLSSASPAANHGGGTALLNRSADMSKFKLEGDPASEKGATWTYASTDDGVEYKLNGTLFKPRGAGPFPAVLISHGQGRSANNYGVEISAEMVKWGLVCIAPNYSYGAPERAEGSPGVTDLKKTNVPDNLKRAHKCLEILAAFDYVDMKRVAAHGHSKGAFLTIAIAGASLTPSPTMATGCSALRSRMASTF